MTSDQPERRVNSNIDRLVVVFSFGITRLNLSEFSCHRRVALGEFLDRKVVCFVVG